MSNKVKPISKKIEKRIKQIHTDMLNAFNDGDNLGVVLLALGYAVKDIIYAVAHSSDASVEEISNAFINMIDEFVADNKE